MHTLTCDVTEAMLRAALVCWGKRLWQRKQGAVCLQRKMSMWNKIKNKKGSSDMHTLTCDVTGAELTEGRCVGESGCGQVSKEPHALKKRRPGARLIAAHVHHIST